jgi:hypothetical protein
MQHCRIYSSISKSSTNYASSWKSTMYITSWASFSSASFSSIRSFSKVSSPHYPSSKSTNWTSSLASFFSTCLFSKVSSHYPSSSKILQLKKLFSIALLHMFLLQSLLTLTLLFKIHQLNKLFSIILLHMFIL